MKIIFAVIGVDYLLEEEVKTGETMKAVIARIARMLYTELADMILAYKAVEPFEKGDEAVKKLQKGNISAHIRCNLQSVSRNHTVKIQACATNKVHFVLDVPSRGASSVRFNYATEHRYVGLAKTAKALIVLSLLIALLFCVLLRITLSLVFGVLGVICSLVTILAFVTSWTFDRKAKGKFILIHVRDDEDDGYIRC